MNGHGCAGYAEPLTSTNHEGARDMENDPTVQAGDCAKRVLPILCVFFDLETTGLNTQRAEVIEVAAVGRLMLPGGSWHQEQTDLETFRTLVKPARPIPGAVSRLTGLTNEEVSAHGVTYSTAVSAWQGWMRQRIRHATAVAASMTGVNDGSIGHPLELWLVGHNVVNYDLRVLASEDARHIQDTDGFRGLLSPGGLLEELGPRIGVADTLRMARTLTRSDRQAWGGVGPPGSHRLGCLYQHVMAKPLQHAHSALGDAIGTAELCERKPLDHALWAAITRGRTLDQCAERRCHVPCGLPLRLALAPAKSARKKRLVSTRTPCTSLGRRKLRWKMVLRAHHVRPLCQPQHDNTDTILERGCDAMRLLAEEKQAIVLRRRWRRGVLFRSVAAREDILNVARPRFPSLCKSRVLIDIGS